jgi:ubiquinone/menaquinone biosynthesis C-methylase UbiE
MFGVKHSRGHSTLEARLTQGEAVRLYDRLAKVYDAWGWLTESRARDRALELADIRDGEAILEIAAGTGLAFARVARNNPGGRNVAMDISTGMLDKARRRLARYGLTNFEIAVGSALAIDEPYAGFDLVLNCYMFDLLDERDWAGVLDEFRRVLKPGGRLVLANMTLGERWGSGIYQRLYDWSPSLMGGCRGVRLSEPLEDHGFEVLSREYIQQCLFPSEVILARKP